MSTFLCLLCLPLLGHGFAAAQEPESPSPPDPGEKLAEPAASGHTEIDIVLEEPETAERDALLYNARIFDQILVQSTEATIRQQKFAAAAGITGGVILLGMGVWRITENPPFNEYTRGLGVMFLTLGMADLTTGVFAATRIPHERHRLERWEKARKDGITEVELAHFEGELQASHELRQGERLVVRWNGLTHAIAGVLVLALTPIPDDSTRSARVSGYVIGGIFVGTGLAAFAASFRDTPSEKAWNDYSQRKISTPGHEFSWRLAPSVSRRGAGLSFGGTF